MRMNETVDLVTENHSRSMRRVALASVLVALSLVVVKSYAFWLSGAVSLLASLVDSGIDMLASVINFFAIRYALQPADAEHRFGHGKAESLAGLGQSVFIMGSAVFLLLQGVDRLVNPQPILALDVAVLVMVVSIMLTLGLVAYQRRVIRQTQSLAVKADSLHYVSDLLSNLGVLLALLISAFRFPQADAILSIAISLYIFYTAIHVWHEAVQHLLDRELPGEVHALIEQQVLLHPDVLGVHGLRTRQSGRQKIIQMHIELDGQLPLVRAHKICEQVEAGLMDAFPGADIIIHQDPYIQNGVSHRL